MSKLFDKLMPRGTGRRHFYQLGDRQLIDDLIFSERNDRISKWINCSVLFFYC